AVEEPAHRALLERQTVQASGFEEFKQAVIDTLTAPPPKPPEPARTARLVFVNRDATLDRGLGDTVGSGLAGPDIDVWFPVSTGTPEEVRLDLEGNLRDCDGLVIVYGATTVLWARQQMQQARKILSLRDTKPSVFALLDGPPDKKEDLGILWP